MKIEKITYGQRLDIVPGHHEELHITIQVEEGDDPEKLVDEAQQWIESRLTPSQDELEKMRYEKRELEHHINQIGPIYGRLKAILDRLGIQPNDRGDFDDIPF